jgi:hypothetical protein
MTADLPPPPPPDERPRAATLQLLDGGAAQVPYGRAFATLAGICVGEPEAREVARELNEAFGVAPSQLTLLGPPDRGWLRFRWLARRWAQGADADGRAWFDDRSLMALLGAVAAGAAVFAWFALEEGALNGAFAMLLLLLTTALGCACLYMAVVGRQPTQFRRFDRKLRRELGRGRWVVLLHGVPPLQQDGLVAHVCARSKRWCAVSPATSWL